MPFLIFLIFLFWTNPRRHSFYKRIYIVSVHSPFSEKTLFNKHTSRKGSNCRFIFASIFHNVHDFFGIDFHIDLFIHFGSKNNDLGIRFGIFWKLLARFSLLFRHIFLHRLLDALFPDFWFPLGHLGPTFSLFCRNWSPKRHPFRSRGITFFIPGATLVCSKSAFAAQRRFGMDF